MPLRCQLKGITCPRYEHQGIFSPTDERVKPLLPDLRHCAECIAYAAPQRPDLQDDLLQVASLTLIEKGPAFNPAHPSSASFGTFIRPQICGALMDAKKRERIHSDRELADYDDAWDPYEAPDAEATQDIGLLWEIPDPRAEFEENLVKTISFKDALPELLQTLTPREREIFACLRENQQNCDIASLLNLSEARVSQLVKQVTLKLASAGQRLGLAE